MELYINRQTFWTIQKFTWILKIQIVSNDLGFKRYKCFNVT